jgi:TetR/AcrR family transcriptional regulator, transcriptional repressor for nem operon
MLRSMPRPADTRERILDAAQRLVIEHGFGSTTVDAVLVAASSSKGAFFHHFPSKAELGRALVERYAAADAELLESLMAAAEADGDDPADQLIAFVAAFERATDAQPGCLFVSFIYEADLAGAGTEEVVAQSILLWRERILDKLETAAERRPSLAPVDLPSLADQVFTIFEGGFLLARALDEPAALRRQLAHLRHYLELLFDRPVRADDGEHRQVPVHST